MYGRIFGIPAAGPMPEMDAGLDQFLHLDNCHAFPPTHEAARARD